jgi:hypothetical protein
LSDDFYGAETCAQLYDFLQALGAMQILNGKVDSVLHSPEILFIPPKTICFK